MRVIQDLVWRTSRALSASVRRLLVPTRVVEAPRTNAGEFLHPRATREPNWAAAAATTVRRAYAFDDVMRQIAHYTALYPGLETGGNLFGYWTNHGAPVVHLATGPGPNARHEATAFFQDERFLLECGDSLFRRFALQHVGEWHSHHRIGLREPSGGDVATVHSGMRQHRLDRFLLVIANIEARAEVSAGFFGFQGLNAQPTPLEAITLDGRSPLISALPPSTLPPEERPPRRAAEELKVCGRDPRPWYQTGHAKQQLTREYLALQALGVAFEVVPADDEVSVRVDSSAGALEWRLPRGWPERPALEVVDSEVVQGRRLDSRRTLIAERVFASVSNADNCQRARIAGRQGGGSSDREEENDQ